MLTNSAELVCHCLSPSVSSDMPDHAGEALSSSQGTVMPLHSSTRQPALQPSVRAAEIRAVMLWATSIPPRARRDHP